MRGSGIEAFSDTSNKEGAVPHTRIQRMSDVTDQYLERARRKAQAQYDSFRTVLNKTLKVQGGGEVQHVSIIAGVRSLN